MDSPLEVDGAGANLDPKPAPPIKKDMTKKTNVIASEHSERGNLNGFRIFGRDCFTSFAMTLVNKIASAIQKPIIPERDLVNRSVA